MASHYYISFDVEATGFPMSSNKMFAVGMCLGRITPSGDISHEKALRFVLSLGKPEGVSWADWWKESKWEPRCYNEFWSKNEDQLNLLMTLATYSDEGAMMRDINSALAAWEHSYEIASIVFDTVAFDSPWISLSLEKYGFIDIGHTRNCKWRSATCSDSFRLGVAGVNPGSDWDTEIKPILASMDKNRNIAPNSHDPIDDARRILDQFASAIAWQWRQNPYL